MKANWVFLKTAIILISINLILTGFLQITITRPIIYYEYLVLPFILIRLNNKISRVIILMGLIFTDITFNLAHLYYFDVFNYFQKLPFLFKSSFNFLFWIILIISLTCFFLISNYLIRLFDNYILIPGLYKHKLFYIIPLFLFLLIYLVDSLNGSSLIGTRDKGKHIINITTQNKGEYNIGKSLIRDLYFDYKTYQLGEEPVSKLADFKNIDKDSSIAYKQFYNSNSNREILIMMESWGIYKNDSLLQHQIEPFLKLDSNKFKVIFEKSFFDGATLQAESRELLNKEGSAYFSVINHDTCDIKSLVQHKSDQNFKTIAVQPFMGNYSVGYRFKKLIGFQIFKDYSFFHDTLGYQNVYYNHYLSVKDEDVFSWIFNNANKNDKIFTYCLTINTHLPFHFNLIQENDTSFNNFKKRFIKYFPSHQTLIRYYRLTQELSYLSELIKKSNIDKIVIVGDHMPPFIFKEERSLFIPQYVPAIIVKKINKKTPNFR